MPGSVGGVGQQAISRVVGPSIGIDMVGDEGWTILDVECAHVVSNGWAVGKEFAESVLE